MNRGVIMFIDRMSLEELSKEFYLVSRKTTYGNKTKRITMMLEEIDLLTDIHKIDKEYLKTRYIVRQKRGKKLNAEQIEEIKNAKGSMRDKARKYNIIVGTVCKIMNDKY